MKLISLNIWGGIVYEPLMNFIAAQSPAIDIFCFQEIFRTDSDVKTYKGARMNIYTEIQNRLPEHQGFFAPAQDGLAQGDLVDFPVSSGLAIFIKKSLTVKKCADIFVVHERNSFQGSGFSLGRNVQYLEFARDGRKCTIANFHGLWDGQPKVDTPDRLQQSHNIKAFLDQIQTPKIICGDFNLLPTTESLRIVKEGLVDLIEKNHISSTRSHYYLKEARFADYAIVSPDIKINEFTVWSDAVSDHLPLYLDFEI